MNIVVIGSTGRTGRLVLEEGIRRRHAMTAFTRRPGALADLAGLRMVVHGDGRNLEDIRRAISGQDAVISIVAPEGRGPTTVISDVARAELTAMREAGVRRIVTVSVSAIEGRRPWILINLVRWILRKPYADLPGWNNWSPPARSIGPSSVLLTFRTDRRQAASEVRPVERTSRTVPITSPAGISRPRFSIWPRTRIISERCS